MAKKRFLAAVFAAIAACGVFAQEHKHNSFDMLLGLNAGLGMTQNIGEAIQIGGSMPEHIPNGNYAIAIDIGFMYDFYLFYWLSFNTGMMAHPEYYAILDQDISGAKKFEDVMGAPLCLTIPLAVHVNIPKAEWLYAGIGINLNIPLAGMLDKPAGHDTKGDFFTSLPIDIGFDFVKPGAGGGRFFFRITPEFHNKGTTIPIGFIWQLYNWKLSGKD
ncbi:MAG: hypothetical protein LBC72_00125 [Spirochaetaceae bacterium]|jgi:hypothetical protein|nr:hypothetical protein [Spirochaetaceae bacterium]